MKNIAITENHLYQKAYQRGKRFVGRLVSVHVLKDYAAHRLMKANPQKQFVNRVGIAVSKKVGGAVIRSRVKRILREGYRGVNRDGAIRTGYLVVLSARPDAASAKSTDVERELRYALGKLDMLRTRSN